MSDAAFTLTPSDDGLTCKQLADRLSLSDSTIRKYTDQQMPHRRGTDGVARYRLEECRRWISENKTPTGRGGKREGSGRKPRDPGANTDRLPLEGKSDEEKQAEAEQKAEAKAEKWRRILSGKSIADPSVVAELIEAGLPKSEADKYESLLRASLRQMEVDQIGGKLLGRSEAARAAARHAAAARNELEALPARASGRLLATLGLDTGRAGAIEQVLEDEVRRVCELVAKSLVIGAGDEALAAEAA